MHLHLKLGAMAFTLSFSPSLFCLLGVLLLLHGAAVTGGCFSMEREALLDFKAGVRDTSGRLSSWTGHHCCTWKGVACDTTTGHVVMLDLRTTNTYDWALRGERMNSSLLALSHLEHLDLSFNDFTGIRMPEFLGSFKKLRYLNLSSTNFMGGIPARLGNLSSLDVLDLSAALDFPSRVDNLDWLSHLTSLTHLDLSFNDFSGIRMPEFIGSFKKLRYLDLSSTHFMGGIPARLGNLSSLDVLDLSDALYVDDYGHGYPVDNLDWLSHLTSLKHLDLSRLNLTDVPDWFSAVNMLLPSLQVLSMYSAGLNSIPASVVHLNFTSTLTVLDLSSNIFDLFPNFFNSTLPEWLGNITSLTHLDLHNSGLHGVLPDAIGDLGSLTFLDLGSNLLEGTVPRSMVNLCRLKELEKSINRKFERLAGANDESHHFRSQR